MKKNCKRNPSDLPNFICYLSRDIKSRWFSLIKRTASQFLNSNSELYAYYLTRNIAGVIEIYNHEDITHIQSLFFDPKYFRRSIRKKLDLRKRI